MARGFAQTTIEPRPEYADILKPQDQFAVPDRDDVGNSLNSWFDRLVMQAGIEMAPVAVLMLCDGNAASKNDVGASYELVA